MGHSAIGYKRYVATPVAEAMVCLGNGVYRLSGVPRMHERPQKDSGGST